MSSSTSPIAIPKGPSQTHPSAHASDRDDGHHLQQQTPLKLQTRRGSRSAPDPWALGPLSSIGGGGSGGSGDHTGGGGASNPSGTNSPQVMPTTPAGNSLSSAMATSASHGSTASTAIPLPSTGASRITIVRVHDDNHNNNSNDGGDMSDGTPSSFGATASAGGAPIGAGVPRPGRSNSWGSNYSSGSNASGHAAPAPPGRSHSPGGARRPGGRMTFAFTSFTPINPPTPSPTTERGRPFSNYGHSSGGSTSTPGTPGNVSPTHTYSPQQQQQQQHAGGHQRRRTHSNPALAPIKPSLTAQQIYDLAMSSTTQPPSAATMMSASAELAAFGGSPAASAAGSAGASPIHTASSSIHHYRAHSHSRPTTPGLTGPGGERTSPAVFRPMPDEVYLPFIDRPAEVSALLSEHPTSRLFQLLEALFPQDRRHSSSRSSSSGGGDEHHLHEQQGEDDPANWTFDRLAAHMRTTTRAEMDDKAWTDATRACIRGRSEALWERFKGALGVPAELEVEEPEVDDEEDELLSAVPVIPADVVVGGVGPGGMTGYADSEAGTTGAMTGGGGGGALSEANPLSSSIGDLASLGYFPPQPIEREAVLEPVFADQSDSDSSSSDDDDEGEGEGGEETKEEGGIGRHFSNLSSGAISEGGWSSGRVMENIGEGSEEENEDDEANTTANAHHHHHSHHHQQHHPQHSRTQSTSMPKSPAVEFEDYGLGSGYMSPQREIRALQITTAPSITSPATIASALAAAAAANNSGGALPSGATGSPHFRTGPDGLDSSLTGLKLTTTSPALHLHQQPTHAGETVISPLPHSALGGGSGDVTPSAESAPNAPASSTTTTTTPPAQQPATTPGKEKPDSASSTGGASGGGGGPRVVLRRPSESIAQTLSSSASAPSPSSSPLSGLPPSSSGGAHAYKGFGGYGLAPANRPYHPALSERGPGNPLFPSSFAGLSVGPTLVANVPKTSRSGSITSGSHYPSSLNPSFRGGANSHHQGGPGSDSNAGGNSPSSLRRFTSLGETAAHRRAAMRNTWADVRDRYEYAVTVASASSDGGRG